VAWREKKMENAQISKHEQADERITARLPRSTRSIIERAAAIYGASINQFIVQAAVERANEVLKNMETLKLSSRDAEIFMNALANPPKPDEKLLDAVRSHDRLVESRD
jgi:uncharacterized protein (DUF1778 family)